MSDLAISGTALRKAFKRETAETVAATDGISLSVKQGALTALVGPDGAGKTTLIRLCTALLQPDAGDLTVLGHDTRREAQAIQDRVGYMPQKFGLYEDLTVQENLDLYADLNGVSSADRRITYPRLMEMTSLAPFTKRLAGKLSGGMKQKLGLACTLVRAPDLLLLDEPTVGVDPLSRRELWEIILRLVNDEHLTVLISTSYLDEAERCHASIVMHAGKVLADSAPAAVTEIAAGRTFVAAPPAGQPARAVQSRLLDDPEVVDAVPEAGRVRIVTTGGAPKLPADPVKPRFEDGFMILLRRIAEHPPAAISLATTREPNGSGVAVAVQDLVRKFGAFTAVDHVSFQVRRGEIFGLLGPNGAGKTTTFRMLCGLIPATSGELEVAGVNLRTARASARQKIGYVAQKFSLYGQLAVTENLDFFAGAYGLTGRLKADRVEWAMTEFELKPLAKLAAGQLPGGFKQRLAMAAALLHDPEILFLDEPTSGADPLARREFWRRITALAEQGVTVIITTHFMEEAEYCDRIVIMDSGQVLAEGTPAAIRARAQPESGREATMEDAFVAIVADARARAGAIAAHAA